MSGETGFVDEGECVVREIGGYFELECGHGSDRMEKLLSPSLFVCYYGIISEL